MEIKNEILGYKYRLRYYLKFDSYKLHKHKEVKLSSQIESVVQILRKRYKIDYDTVELFQGWDGFYNNTILQITFNLKSDESEQFNGEKDYLTKKYKGGGLSRKPIWKYETFWDLNAANQQLQEQALQ